jgi:hypothetical protein
VVDGKKYRHHQLSKMTDKLRKILNLKETLWLFIGVDGVV